MSTMNETIASAISQVQASQTDADFRITDNADATKKLAFELSAITTATTRTCTVPNLDCILPAVYNSSNLLLGASAYSSLTSSATYNVAVGGLSALNLSSGDYNTGLGYASIRDSGFNIHNTGVGYAALMTTTTNYNTAVGSQALNLPMSGNYNTAIGYNVAGNDIGGSNIAIGANTTIGNGSGSNRIIIGTGGTAVADNSLTIAGSTSITGFYFPALASATTANTLYYNSSSGLITYGAAPSGGGGSGVTVSGSNAGAGESSYSFGSSNYNAFFGVQCGNSYSAAGNNTAMGSSAFRTATGIENTAIGNYAMETNSGLRSVAVGYAALRIASGSNNACVGYNSGRAVTTGEYLAGLGRDALYNCTTGGGNAAFGASSCYNVTTGAQNVGFGLNGGADITTGSYNICIGSFASVDTGARSHSIMIGYNGNTYAANDSIKIGFGSTPYTKCFVDGIRGITTVNNNAVAVLIDSAGQLGTVSSSIRFKENVTNMDNADLLYQLRPVNFNYKTDESKSKQYGLIAEEVNEVMPDLVAHDQTGQIETVKYHLLPAILLDLVKKQKAAIEQLTARVTALETA